MQGLIQAVDQAREASLWYLSDEELRVLFVRCSGELRPSVLQELYQAQFHDASRRVCFFVEAAIGQSQEPDAWQQALEQLREEYADLREEAGKQEPALSLPALPPSPTDASSLVAFSAQLRQVAECLAEPPEGMPEVCIGLVPAALAEPAEWAAAVQSLLQSESLAKLPFVVVDASGAETGQITQEIRGKAQLLDLRASATLSSEALDAMIAGMKSAPSEAGAHRMAGMAGPLQAPPARAREAKAPTAEQLPPEAAGYADPARMRQIQIAILEAAQAFGKRQVSEGIRAQTRARDLFLEAGQLEPATVLELSLGAHLLQADAVAQAISTFETAFRRAQEAELPRLQVQALMATAGAYLLLQQPDQAIEAYGNAGSLGEQQREGVPLALTVECFRMQGQLLLGAGREAEATGALRRAILVAEGGSVVDRKISSAAQAARELAQVLQGSGMLDQADALEQQAVQWEQEPLPKPEKSDAPSASTPRQPPEGSESGGAARGASSGDSEEHTEEPGQ